MGTLKREIAPIFDLPDEATEEQALAEAEAEVKAGKFISHDAVVKWLRSWGKPDELPPPKPGESLQRRVIWAPLAVKDVTGIRAYIVQFNPDAATRMAGLLISAADSLCALPDRGRPIANGLSDP